MTEMNTENNLEAMQRAHGPLLEVKNLQVDFTTDEGKAVHAVRNSSFSVYPGQWVAIVGESGSGKSTSAMAVLGLLPGTGHVVGGSIKLDGQEISGFKQKDFDKLRGSKMGLVPQDPMSNLNPVWRIGTQVKEALVANNMDIDHEKRSEFAKALAGDEVELKGNDDETFLGSKELPDLIAAAKEALVKIGKSGDELDKIMARFAEEWVPGSETRWRVADGLIKAGVKDDDAWYIAKKYVVGSTMDDRIAGLLSEAGLPDAATRARQFPHEFSGGMRQRALIAIGLACRPELLIADEPTSALDVTVQKKILDHLHMLTDSLGTAVLFITHDLGLAAERAQHIVVMYKGQVVESGPSLEVLQHPQHPYTKRLVAAAPSLASQRIISVKEHGGDASRVMEHKVNEDSLKTGESIITVNHLTREFKLPRKKEMFKAVDDVSFSVKKGTTLAIVGESGSGKSTLMHCMAGLDTPSSGKVIVEGLEVSSMNQKQLTDLRREQIGFIFQSFNLVPTLSAEENILLPLQIAKRPIDREWFNQVVKVVGLEKRLTHRPSQLSGGQQQRVACARAIMARPSVIFADEPTGNLDSRSSREVLGFLRDSVRDYGQSIVMVTHDPRAASFADRVLVLADGNITRDMQHPTYNEILEVFAGDDDIDDVPAADMVAPSTVTEGAQA